MRTAPALVLCACATLAFASRHVDGPPPGHTGGFDEPTCQACHEGADINLEGGAIGVEGLPTRYIPGARYDVVVVLQDEEMGRAGFQGAVRYLEGPRRGRSAGRLDPQDGRTALQRSEHGIEYIAHTGPGSDVASPLVASWMFVWTAPPDSAAVMFHAAGNAANGDNSPFSDLIYTVAQRIDGPAPDTSRSPGRTTR